MVCASDQSLWWLSQIAITMVIFMDHITGVISRITIYISSINNSWCVLLSVDRHDSSFLTFSKGDLILLDEHTGEHLLARGWAHGVNDRTKKRGNLHMDSIYVLPAITKPQYDIVVSGLFFQLIILWPSQHNFMHVAVIWLGYKVLLPGCCFPCDWGIFDKAESLPILKPVFRPVFSVTNTELELLSAWSLICSCCIHVVVLWVLLFSPIFEKYTCRWINYSKWLHVINAYMNVLNIYMMPCKKGCIHNSHSVFPGQALREEWMSKLMYLHFRHW